MFLVKHTLDHQFSAWHFRMFWLRHQLTLDNLRHWALVSAVVLGGVIGLQMIYPRSFTLPRTRVSGQYVGLQSRGAVEQKVAAVADNDIIVSTPDVQMNIAPENLGLFVNPQATATKATNYTLRERMIPFSWFFVRKHMDNYVTNTDDQKLQTFALELEKQSKLPADATIKVEGDKVVTVPSQLGATYDTETTKAQIKAAQLTRDMTVSITPKVTEPAIETAVAEALTTKINQRLQTPLQIDAVTSTIDVSAPTMASWLVIKSDPTNKVLTAEFDREKVKETLMTLSTKVYIAQTPNRVVLVDGEAVGSNTGLAGQAMLVEDSINEVISAANTGSTSATIKLQAVTPNTQIVRTYTKTSKGVQALINYWVQTHGGQFGIAFRNMDGSIVAAYNGDRQFTSASIYKIYVAYAIYSQVAAGNIVLEQPTGVDLSVSTCLERMITWSDNLCGHALGDMIGWQASNPLLQAKGIGSTTMQFGNQLTTANDAATFLTQLAHNNLIRTDLNSALVQLMHRQVYRQGIPAGSRGSSVANKIGQLYGIEHDVAIVYHPKGAYVLSIFSYGSSVATFSSLAQQISDVMNQ